MARAIRNAIRANRFARIIRNRNPYFNSASGRFARITRISDSRESPDSRESCESIRANHATKFPGFFWWFSLPFFQKDQRKDRVGLDFNRTLAGVSLDFNRIVRNEVNRERKKTHKEKKHVNKILHEKVPGFWGESCLCVFLPHKE